MLTTHDDPARAVAAGVAALLARPGSIPPRFTRVVHATTLFTNALIERKGARAPGSSPPPASRTRWRSGASASTSSTTSPSPSPSRWCRATCASRWPSACGADGRDRAPPRRARCWPRGPARSAEAGVEAIAVVFLHAYANPRHEAEAARLHRGAHLRGSRSPPRTRWRPRSASTSARPPRWPTPISSRWPSTTWSSWRRRLAEAGIPAPLLLMLSSGGLTHVAEAERAPVQHAGVGPRRRRHRRRFLRRGRRRRQRARLRHGRHHRQALAGGRRRAARPPTASRPRGSGASSRAAGCPSASPPSS